MKKLSMILTLLALAVSAPADELMGPPAPKTERRAISVDERLAEIESAEDSWKWYAGAWAMDCGTTALALNVNPYAREVWPLWPDKPVVGCAAKAGVGAALWATEVWLTRKGEGWLGRAGRWFFVGVAAAAGGWNLSVAF